MKNKGQKHQTDVIFKQVSHHNRTDSFQELRRRCFQLNCFRANFLRCHSAFSYHLNQKCDVTEEALFST